MAAKKPVAKPVRHVPSKNMKQAAAPPKKAAGHKKPVAKAKPKAAAPTASPLSTRGSAIPAIKPGVIAAPPARAVPQPAVVASAGPGASRAATSGAEVRVRRPPPGGVTATAVHRSPRPEAQSAAEGDVDDDGASLLAGPRNVQPYIAKRGEQYMGRQQLEHFRAILNDWKLDLMEEVDRTVSHMKDEASNFPDPNDRATQEEEFSLELRTRDRERKLIRKIDEAIKRIDDGSYGYCLETGEEIGIKRLEARPVATLSIEAQERRERREKQYGDRDDRYR